MFDKVNLRSLFGRGSRRRSPRRAKRRNSNVFGQGFESLEDRALLTAVGFETPLYADPPADLEGLPVEQAEIVESIAPSDDQDNQQCTCYNPVADLAEMFQPMGSFQWMMGPIWFGGFWGGADTGGGIGMALQNASPHLQVFLVGLFVNNDPVADAGGAYEITEGDSLTLDGSLSADADGDLLDYAWDVNDSGLSDAASGRLAQGDTTGEQLSLSWEDLQSLGMGDDGTYEVTLQVDDGWGGTDTATTTVTVLNAAPTAEITGLPESAEEGSEITLTADASDAGTADTLAYEWSVTKDGAAYAAGDGETLSFTPDDNGVYEVTLSVTDDDGGATTVSEVIDVANVDPKATITGLPEAAAEGTEITLSSEVADAGAADTHTLAWDVTKDGEGFSYGEGESFAFTPDDNGVYEVTLNVTDDDGGATTVSEVIEVSNVDPKAAITGLPEAAAEGTEITLSSEVADAGAADTHTLAWDVTKDGEGFSYGEGESFSFTPDDNGIYEVTLNVTDDDGGATTVSEVIDVANVDPKAAITGLPEAAAEGTEITLSSEVADAGAADTHTLAWDVTKDGEEYSYGEGESFAFTPDDNGVYQVTLNVTDDDGGATTVSEVIEVSNVDPKAAITGLPEAATEGTEITLSSEVADAGANDTHTLAWQVTKDGEAYAAGEGESLSFTPDDNGVYEVTLTATDNDGGTGSAVTEISVENVAPDLSDVAVSSLSAEKEISGRIADVSPADSFELRVDWGDGTVDTFEYPAGTTEFHETHEYAGGGIFLVDMLLSDDDGGLDTYAQMSMVTGAGLRDGVLQVVGTEGDDVVHVSQLGGERLLLMADFLSDPWHLQSFALDEVERIDVVTVAGNDLAVVADNVGVPAILDGGPGGDILVGGAADDILIGGDQADLLLGGLGANLLRGGPGLNTTGAISPDDTLLGEFAVHETAELALLSYLDEMEV